MIKNTGDANFKALLFLFVIVVTITMVETRPIHFDTTSVVRPDQIFQDLSTPDPDVFDKVQIPVETVSCHSSSLAKTSDNKLFVAWYGGTREGSKDVKIYGAKVGMDGEISPISVLLDRKRLARDVRRYIRKLGNPVVYLQNERLWLFVTSVSLGGWSGSSINYSYSDDQGVTWKPFKRLRATPLLNISSLVRTPIIPLRDDAFLLPAYCEHATKYGLALTFDASGVLTRRVKTPIHQNQPALQPSIIPLDDRQALAFLRTPHQKVGISYTNNGGRQWKSLPCLPLDNPDSSVGAFKLNDDTLVLVGNPGPEKRTVLCAWLCPVSDLSQWERVATIENEPGAEFSYPSICSTDSATFLSYTCKRRSIKIVNLSSILSKNNTATETDSQKKGNQ